MIKKTDIERTRQVNVKLDEATLNAISDTVKSQTVSVVTRKLLCLWLQSPELQRDVKLADAQSVCEFEG